MLAYRNKLLDNLLVRNEAQAALDLGLITEAENALIKEKYPSLVYHPNFFMRVGYFIATLIAVNVAIGFFSLTVLSLRSDKAWGFFTGICALIIYACLEWLIHERKHFRSGVDDGLMWCSGGYMLTSLILFNNNNSSLYISFIILILAVYFTLRFASPLMSFVACCSLLSSVMSLLILTGPVAKLIIPFAIMLTSAVMYLLVRRIAILDTARHYLWSCILAETVSLITFYLAGNYYIIREAGSELLNIRLAPGEGIAGGWFFWTMTVVVPPIYIIRGFAKRDVLLLRVGLAAFISSIITVWYYSRFISIEALMVTGGILLIVVSYFVSRLFTRPRWGIVDIPKKAIAIPGIDLVEGVIVSETLASNGPGGQPEDFQFGGGSSGGGGATGQW